MPLSIPQITCPFAGYTKIAARQRLGKITNMVHFSYEEEDSMECIPIYENLCFALSLIASHTLSEVLEGKNLLQRLLAFQTKEGSFPVYIHNFPFGWKKEQAVRSFLPLFILLQCFETILGKELEFTVKKVAQRLMHFMEGFEKTLPEHFQFRLLVYQYLFLKKEDLFPKIEEIWTASTKLCLTSSDFSELLLGLQLLDRNDASVQKMWDQAKEFFHAGLQTFRFSSSLERQQGYFPKPSLFDFFFMEDPKLIQKKFSAQDSIFLQSALILKTDPVTAINERSCFCLPKKKQMDHHPAFYLLWSIDHKIHSLACFDFFDFEEGQSSVKLFFSKKIEEDDKKDHFDISLYCSFLFASIYVEGRKATTFQLGEKLQVISKDFRFEIIFSKIQGDGAFFGHIFPSNRKSQDKKSHQAFDWKIALRSVLKGSLNASFCAEIRLL